MTEPCPPSICEASQAETESIELDFLHGGLYWQFVSRTQGSQVCVLLLGWLAGWRTDPLRCRRPKAACALLMCCHSPAGWAGLDRLRWRSPSFPQLIQADFAWLMNCDEAQLQGCLCFFFFFFLFKPQGKPVRDEVWNIVKTPLMALNLRISWLGCTRDTLHWAPERSPLSGCKGCTPYSQLLMFQYQEEERKQRHKPARTWFTLHNLKMSQSCDRRRPSTGNLLHKSV